MIMVNKSFFYVIFKSNNKLEKNNLEGNLNEQNFTSLILAIVANLLLDFSPCKEVFSLLYLN